MAFIKNCWGHSGNQFGHFEGAPIKGRLGPVLEEPDYVARLRAASACVVTQRPGVGANFLPSKLLPALATGTPVLAVCEPASPLGQEVTAGGFGEVIVPGNHASLARTLRRWQKEPILLDEMRVRAVRRSGLYGQDRILAVYEQELLKLTMSVK